MKTTTNEQRAAIRDLLSENEKALQFLHVAKGFDFEKNFMILRTEGSFTANKVKKAIEANITTGDYIAAIMLKANDEKYCSRDLYYVHFHGLAFDAKRADKLDYWKYNVDYMWSVGDFEETRKKKTDHIYIIAQSTGNATTAGNKPVNMAQRFKLKEARRGCCDGVDYIRALDLETTDGQNEKFAYEPWGRFYCGEKRSDDIADYIDKNGYLLRSRRLALYQRARELQAKREKAALEVYDFTADDKAARVGLELCKTKIAEKIAAAQTYDDGATAERLARGLAWMLSEFDRLKKDFPSIGAKKAVYERIGKKISEILEVCQ